MVPYRKSAEQYEKERKAIDEHFERLENNLYKISGIDKKYLNGNKSSAQDIKNHPPTIK